MAYATVEQSRVLMLKAAILTDLQRLQKKTINVYNYYDPPIDISVIIMIQIQMEIDHRKATRFTESVDIGMK